MLDQNSYVNFRKALNEIYRTPGGKLVIEYLEQVYVTARAVDPNPTVLAYKLGQKEAMQTIVAEAKQEYVQATGVNYNE